MTLVTCIETDSGGDRRGTTCNDRETEAPCADSVANLRPNNHELTNGPESFNSK